MQKHPEIVDLPGGRLYSLWVPVLVAGLITLLVVFIVAKLRNDVKADREHIIADHAQRLLDDIESDLVSRIFALRRIVDRWEVRGGTPKEEFMADAQHYMNDLKGFQGIGVTEADFIIKWAVPRHNNDKVVGFDLRTNLEHLQSLEEARSSGQPVMSDPVPLVTQKSGLLLNFPIVIDDQFVGMLVAALNAEKWLVNVLRINDVRSHLEDVYVHVTVSGEPIFTQKGWDTAENTMELSAGSEIMDQSVKVECRPTAWFMARTTSSLPMITGVAGIFFACMVGFVIYYFQKATLEGWRNAGIMQRLEEEVQERKDIEAVLTRMTARMTLAAQAGQVGVWEWDVVGGELIWDDLMFKMYDVPRDVIPTYEVWEGALHPEDREMTVGLLQAAMAGEASFDLVFRVQYKDKSIHYIKAAAHMQRHADGTVYRIIGVNWDMTEQKVAEEQIRHLATHDTLTGLPTLRLGKDRVAVALETARRKGRLIAILFVDLDGFKGVNDTLGHDAGDDLLREVSRRLVSCVRGMDTVARIGGDEFLVVLNELSQPFDAEVVASKIVEAISLPHFYDGNKMQVGASVGIATCNGACGADIEDLIKQADEAMYRVKKRGKNGYEVG